jgi:maleate isomerase
MKAFVHSPKIEEAAELLATAPVHAIALCFTNHSFLSTLDEDRKLVDRLQRRTGGKPVIATCLSAITALHALGAQRIALSNPPWIEQHVTDAAVRYFASARLEVVFAGGIDIPRSQTDAQPGRIYEWARSHVPPEADAIFIAGNGCRAVGAIEAIESDLGRPVITANQVLAWHAMRLAGTRAKVSGYGRLFDTALAL